MALLFAENAKIYAAVAASFDEKGLVAELSVFRVFQYKPSFVGKQIFFKNDIMKLFNSLHVVGWIGKNEVELLVAPLKKNKCILLYGSDLFLKS